MALLHLEFGKKQLTIHPEPMFNFYLERTGQPNQIGELLCGEMVIVLA